MFFGCEKARHYSNPLFYQKKRGSTTCCSLYAVSFEPLVLFMFSRAAKKPQFVADIPGGWQVILDAGCFGEGRWRLQSHPGASHPSIPGHAANPEGRIKTYWLKPKSAVYGWPCDCASVQYFQSVGVLSPSIRLTLTGASDWAYYK